MKSPTPTKYFLLNFFILMKLAMKMEKNWWIKLKFRKILSKMEQKCTKFRSELDLKMETKQVWNQNFHFGFVQDFSTFFDGDDEDFLLHDDIFMHESTSCKLYFAKKKDSFLEPVEFSCMFLTLFRLLVQQQFKQKPHFSCHMNAMFSLHS